MMPDESDATAHERPTGERAQTSLLDRFDTWLRRVGPRAFELWNRGIGFVGPIILFLAPLLPLAILRPELVGGTLAFYAIAALAGVDVSVALGVAAGFTWWYIFAWVMWGQMLLTAFLLWNIQLLRRWAPAGRYFARKERKAVEAYARRPWMRRFHFWGLTFFTVLPVGSGVYVGVILGKYTGLADAKTWSALMMGTAVWLFILSFFGVHVWDRFIPHIRWF